jgi:dTMP kinase
MLVAVEGVDGAGKGTQTRLLVERAEREGLSTRVFSFPRYGDNPFSVAAGRYLDGDFGDVDEVAPELAALLYAGDRFAAREEIARALDECELVVCDRYVASNMAHQGAKVDADERARFLEWLEAVEYGAYGLPRPEVTILLDMPPARARELVLRKHARSYTALAQDIHERAEEHLEAAREVYLELARREPAHWHVIPAARTPEEVAADVWRAVRSAP